jgi:hypothetical protein
VLRKGHKVKLRPTAADVAFGLMNAADGLISHPQLRTITLQRRPEKPLA